jgi:hypothetical protein
LGGLGRAVEVDQLRARSEPVKRRNALGGERLATEEHGAKRGELGAGAARQESAEARREVDLVDIALAEPGSEEVRVAQGFTRRNFDDAAGGKGGEDVTQ